MRSEQIREFAGALVGTLERWHAEQNRGPLAKLRRGLSETTRHEADFVLGRCFGPVAVGHPVFETVAGCFALYPGPCRPKIGNFGATMRDAMGDRMKKEDEAHARFRRLLACATIEEICRHVPHAVRLARSREAQVDYRCLFEDLSRWEWGDRVKVAWARTYWDVPAAPLGIALAGAGSLEGDADAGILPE